MEMLDMSLLQMAIWGVSILIAVGVPSIFPNIRRKAAWKLVKSRLDAVADEVVAAVDKDSEGGKSISKGEWKAIIGSAIKKGNNNQN